MNLLASSLPQTSMNAEVAASISAARLGELAASIAHEVNQPLSGIITNAGTCLRMLAMDPPNIHGALETARRTIRDGNRAAEVVTHLRALFANKDFLIEPVSLNELAKDVCASMTDELGTTDVALELELTEDLPPVAGIRVQLQQVIFNLLRNGVDAMRNVEDHPKQLTIRTSVDDCKNVRLSVVDSGAGFDPQTAERLFETFYTTKNNGMGIGLSISKCIVERFRGRIWARNNEGPGSSFSFCIPSFACDIEGHGGWASATHTLVSTDTMV
jgi:signal transduction histidine kinase